MKFENTDVWGFQHALRGMRNPKESWDRNDSHIIRRSEFTLTAIGEKDMELARRLIRAGSEHRKFLRQVFVSVDITAPLYWWKEFDTYKVGTTANSTSTMHTIQNKPITLESFEIGDLVYVGAFDYPDASADSEVSIRRYIEGFIFMLENLRCQYIRTGDKTYWKELIRWLPESWLQKRTVTMNYENLFSICHQRKNHKLTEWSETFMNWARSLPCSDEFIFITKNESEDK